MKKQKGITLIALVITIIVLLILAGVSISMVIGENGILNQADSATVATREAAAKEELELAWASVDSDYWNEWANNSSIKKEEYFNDEELPEKLNKYLDGKGFVSSVKYDELIGTYKIVYTSESDDMAYTIEIDANGNTIVGGSIHTSTSTIIPKGGTYTTTDGTVYTAGEYFPTTMTSGDIYTYGSCKYTFSCAQFTSEKEFIDYFKSMTGSTTDEEWQSFLENQGMTEAQLIQLGYSQGYIGEAGYFEVGAINNSISGHCEIVGTINNMKVTSVAKRGFYGCKNLTSITIPNNVTTIGEYAFGNSIPGVSSLVSVELPDTLTTIGSNAFNRCDKLASITIPNSVTSIGQKAFTHCYSLTSLHIPASVTYFGRNSVDSNLSGLMSITVDENNTVYDSRDNCNAIIETATNTLIIGCQSTTIPSGVTSIADYAFAGCKTLKTISIPDTVTSIGSQAFVDCINLTSVTLSNNLTSIENYVFENCESLTSIFIPASVNKMYSGSFESCSGLTSIIVDENNVVYDSRDNCNAIIITEKNSILFGCQNTIIPESVTSIGGRAFYYCDTLTSINIPESVTSIGSFAFSGSGLTSITLPNSIKQISSYTFEWCDSLTSVIFSDSVTRIDESAFKGCKNLTSVKFGEGLKTIYESAFMNCESLTKIVIPKSVTSIGKNAFYYCDDLKYVYFENETAPSFGYGSFYKGYGTTTTFYFKNSTVAGKLKGGTLSNSSHYNSKKGTKSTNYDW